jgi:hypothetical protein
MQVDRAAGTGQSSHPVKLTPYAIIRPMNQDFAVRIHRHSVSAWKQMRDRPEESAH